MITQSSTARLLQYITRTSTANSDEDVDYLLKLMNPTDSRDEMGKIYEDVLGYNPITHFDYSTLRKIFQSIKNDAPEEYLDTLVSHEETIITEALEEYGNDNYDLLKKYLLSSIESITGWIPDEDTIDNLLDDDEEDVDFDDNDYFEDDDD